MGSPGFFDMELVGSGFNDQPKSPNNAREDFCEQHQGSKYIGFQSGLQVLRGKCIRHLNNCILYSGIQLNTGEQCIIRKLIAQIDNINSITEQLKILMKINHPNLAVVKDYAYEIRDKCYLYLLYDFEFDNIFISQFISNANMSLPEHFKKILAEELLQLMDFLRDKHNFYLDSDASSIYINKYGNLKFVNYGIIDEKISGVNDSLNNDFQLLPIYRASLSLAEDDPDELKTFELEKTMILYLQNQNKECLHVELQKDNNSLQRMTSCESKFKEHFDEVEILGKGGFGKVYKVEGKIDKKYYAVKKIKLGGKNQDKKNQLYREVQYLSNLIHENIVRYIDSWLENGENDSDEDESDEFDDDMVFEVSSYNTKGYLSTLTNSDSIVFEVKDNLIENSSVKKDSLRFPKSVLYIKMEFCDKRTLDEVIEKRELQVPSDIQRIWKYFRSIVEGLAYIHEFGIIHRDLKPKNLFLDANDNIKIGDFGLATKNKKYKTKSSTTVEKENRVPPNECCSSDSFTEAAGTTMYQAPELRTQYPSGDEKLDMYSLGLTFFEMCYPRPVTMCEKIKIFEKLRGKTVQFPNDFNFNVFRKQSEIIKSLLVHDPKIRPSSKTLLNHPHIHFKYKELQNLLNYLINPRNLNMHGFVIKKLIHSIIPINLNEYNYRNTTNIDTILQHVINIFKIHGGENICRPSLVQKNECVSNCKNCINLISDKLTKYTFPCNSRIHFAKYAAFMKNRKVLKRYSVDKRFELSKEQHLCNFDIITFTSSTETYLQDAEILYIIYEIKVRLLDTCIGNDRFVINISHTSLMQAIFQEAKMTENQLRLYQKIGRIPKHILKAINSLKNIKKFFKKQFSSQQISSLIKSRFTNEVTRKNAQKGLTELKLIITLAKQLGIGDCINVDFGLLNSFEQYSGMFFECLYINENTEVLLCSGGRYDEMIPKFQNFHYPKSERGVGLSMCLEKWEPLTKLEKDLTVIFSCNQAEWAFSELQVISSLWEAGIACIYVKTSNLNEAKQYCEKNKSRCSAVLNYKEKCARIIKDYEILEEINMSEVTAKILELKNHQL